MNRFVGIVAVVAIAVAADAYASECIGFATTTLLDRNDVVFAGLVTQIRLVGPEATVTPELVDKDAVRNFTVAVTFKLTERYSAGAFTASSGNAELTLNQWAALGMTDYWHKYEVGHRYLVFASTSAPDSLGMKPVGITSRGCDAWDLATPLGQQILKELEAALP